MKSDLVLQTDFSLSTGYVAAMYGVIKLVDRSLNAYDLNHEIRAFDVKQASELLKATIPFWPQGTVFVSVVDPGVGTARRGCVALLGNGSYVVTPDNGTLTALKDQVVAIRQIDETVNRLPGSENGNTFHGRDVFAYCAARLAAGIIDYNGVGPAYPLSELVTYTQNRPEISEGKAVGEIGGAERHFGGVSFNITAEEFAGTGIQRGDMTHITITKGCDRYFDGDVLYHWSFGYVPVGEPILYNGSTSVYISLSLNQRNFVQKYLPDIWDTGVNFSDYKVTITKK